VAAAGDDRYDDHKKDTPHRVKYDGVISNHPGYCVIGGNVEDVESVLKDDYRDGMPAGEAAKLARRARNTGTEHGSELGVESLEVCLLDRKRTGRKFCRLSTEEVQGMLDT